MMQLVHNLVVFWMIGSEHQEWVVTQLTKILKSLGTSHTKRVEFSRHLRENTSHENLTSITCVNNYEYGTPELYIKDFKLV